MYPDKNGTGNLEVLAKRMALWIYGRGKEIAVGLLKSGLGGLDRRGLLPGTLPATNPRFKAARHRLARSHVHVGSRAKVSTRELLVVRLKTGRLTGPEVVVDNLAMPGLLRKT
jgi:hypothetical protein